MVIKSTFSVIIPTFNREAFLLDAVRSAVNASPENTEIIVVNDGSEFSENVKSALDILNISVLKTEGGIGAGGARNQGAEHATGQWLLFLDDDDLIAFSYWKSLSEFLLKGPEEHHRSYGFCQTTILNNREKMHRIAGKKAISVSYVLEESNLLRPKLVGLSCGFWLSTTLFREVGGFDGQLRVNEDTDLCLSLIACGGKCYVSSFNGAIIYVGLRVRNISQSVTKACNAADRASYFKRIIDKHTKLLDTDKAANAWIWKRYLKMAARAKDRTAIANLAANKNLALLTKLFLAVYWTGSFFVAIVKYSVKPCHTQRMAENIKSKWNGPS